MCTFYKLWSHDRPPQLLKDHLEKVTNIALEYHSAHGGSERLNAVIKIIGMGHDFAKGLPDFQLYIQNPLLDLEAKEALEKSGHANQLKNHGQLSAAFVYWQLPEQWKLLGFLMVLRHHGSLKDAVAEIQNFRDYEDSIKAQASHITGVFKTELEALYSIELDEFLAYIQSSEIHKSLKRIHKKTVLNLEQTLEFNYLYSLLLNADKGQLVNHGTWLPEEKLESKWVSDYVQNLRSLALAKNPANQNSAIFKVRGQLQQQLTEALKGIDVHLHRVLSINVPTGTGKTLLSYRAAFEIARKKAQNNAQLKVPVIYCLPFTSVIDQNHQVMQAVFQSGQKTQPKSAQLLKYHSLTPIEYEDYHGYDARFCFENWQSQIVVTTFVQFFNTLFKIGENAIAQRFNRLAGSVVILDEVQAIDTQFFGLIRTCLDIMAQHYNMTIILVTATMPYLLETKPLILQPEAVFAQLNRITIEYHGEEPISLETFAQSVLEDINRNPQKRFLMILNTVGSARWVHQYLKLALGEHKDPRLLTTEIIPKHRLEYIQELKENPKSQIVVSTQLVEAGVDIDMDVVYRDFAPLDSINQSGGRANRNGIGGLGVLKIYKLIDDHKDAYCSKIYPQALLFATEQLLKGKTSIPESQLYTLYTEYAQRIRAMEVPDFNRKYQKAIGLLAFETARNLFELISKEQIKTDVYVIADDEARALLHSLEGNDPIEDIELKNIFRKLNAFRIGVPSYEIKNKTLEVEQHQRFGFYYLESRWYSRKEGVLRDLPKETIRVF